MLTLLHSYCLRFQLSDICSVSATHNFVSQATIGICRYLTTLVIVHQIHVVCRRHFEGSNAKWSTALRTLLLSHLIMVSFVSTCVLHTFQNCGFIILGHISILSILSFSRYMYIHITLNELGLYAEMIM